MTLYLWFCLGLDGELPPSLDLGFEEGLCEVSHGHPKELTDLLSYCVVRQKGLV